MRPIRVLVVDDSPTMRAIVTAAVNAADGMTVIGHAADAAEARAAIKALDPDVLTLDVEMPGMNGLEFLEKIMRLRPMPVIMVSTLTAKGAEITIRALETGAFDCIGKPSVADPGILGELPAKIEAAAASRIAIAARHVIRYAAPALPAPAPDAYRPGRHIVAIGASTGGVEALTTLLSAFPENCPPTVIAQHMPRHFTKSFAARLDRLCAPRVSEAEEGDLLEPGRIYIAPGGDAHLVVADPARPRCALDRSPPASGHRPSVDVLFNSVASLAGANAVGVLLTGMGRDGAEGLLSMRRRGARTIAQDRETSLVYGMPRVAEELGAAEVQLPLERIAQAVLATTNQNKKRTA